jgi:hypothetical protein
LLFWHLPGGAEEIHEKPHNCQCSCRFIFGFFEGSLDLKVYLLAMSAFVIPALAWKG